MRREERRVNISIRKGKKKQLTATKDPPLSLQALQGSLIKRESLSLTFQHEFPSPAHFCRELMKNSKNIHPHQRLFLTLSQFSLPSHPSSCSFQSWRTTSLKNIASEHRLLPGKQMNSSSLSFPLIFSSFSCLQSKERCR